MSAERGGGKKMPDLSREACRHQTGFYFGERVRWDAEGCVAVPEEPPAARGRKSSPVCISVSSGVSNSRRALNNKQGGSLKQPTRITPQDDDIIARRKTNQCFFKFFLNFLLLTERVNIKQPLGTDRTNPRALLQSRTEVVWSCQQSLRSGVQVFCIYLTLNQPCVQIFWHQKKPKFGLFFGVGFGTLRLNELMKPLLVNARLSGRTAAAWNHVYEVLQETSPVLDSLNRSQFSSEAAFSSVCSCSLAPPRQLASVSQYFRNCLLKKKPL